MKTPYIITAAVVAASLFGCGPKPKESQETPLISYKVARVFPHDKKSFTQGLTIDKGRLLESTGQDDSWIAEVDIASGKPDRKVLLDKKYFGEGIAILNNKLYQLTWQNHIGFIYDARTFAKIGEFNYSHEGWGITHDGKQLIVSDGTDKLHFLDTVTLKEKSTVLVHDGAGAVKNINELEYIEGYVFANQWQTDFILKIDPVTGNVVGKLDLSLVSEKLKVSNPGMDVLNGIAWEKKSKLLLVTGKFWPNLLAITLREEK